MGSYGSAIDVSHFMLLEDSGDSEIDSSPLRDHVDYQDDDAESCSCGLSDSYCASDVYCRDDDDVEAPDLDVKMDIQEYCDETSGYNRCADEQRSILSVAAAEESLNESEKNRLFWEACLAS